MFPLNSIEVSQQVEKIILPKISGMSVDVHNPNLTLQIDLRNEGKTIIISTHIFSLVEHLYQTLTLALCYVFLSN